MEAIGTLLMLGGILAFLITGLGYARSQKAFVDFFKDNFNETWVSLGKPELTPFQPFRSLPLTELVASISPELGPNPQLNALHAKAKLWFFAFGINFGVVFLGGIMLGASS
jgi:hypothetical protein